MGLTRLRTNPSGPFEVVDGVLPAGLFFPIPVGGAVPPGTLLCDGSQFSKKRYPELYTALRASYGSDTGQNATLPDFRGRMVIGVGAADTVGAHDGLAAASRTPRHSHTPPSHSHGGMTHTHTSPSHSHPAESHQHTIDPHFHGVPAHGHSMFGSTANTSGKSGGLGPNQAASNTHNHDSGSYSLDVNTAPSPLNTTAPGNSGAAAGSHGATTPANTGPPSTGNTGPATGPAFQGSTELGFAAVQWVVTTGKVHRRFLRRR